MKTIAIISQKGGAGKTTIAVHLAVEYLLNGKEAVIVDLDPQASSANWADNREKEKPHVVSAQASRLNNIKKAAKEGGADVLIIDTSPHSERTSLEAIRSADIVLIPCRPTILDLRAIGNTIDLAKIAKKEAKVILNTVPPRGSLAQEAKKAIEGYGAEVLPCMLGNRASYIHSLTCGLTAQEYEPKGKASNEIKKLYKWINSNMKN